VNLLLRCTVGEVFIYSAETHNRHFGGFFEKAKASLTFLTPKLPWGQQEAIMGSEKSRPHRKTQRIEYLFCHTDKKERPPLI